MDTIQSTARQHTPQQSRRQNKQQDEGRQAVFAHLHHRAPIKGLPRSFEMQQGSDSTVKDPQCQGQLALPLEVARARPLEVGVASQDVREVEEVKHWARRWMIVYLGVFASRRPRQQLLHWCSPEVYQTVSRRQQLLAARERRLRLSRGSRAASASTALMTPVVRSVHLDHVAGGVYEVAVVLRTGDRFTATAIRVVIDHDHRGRRRARVTALEL